MSPEGTRKCILLPKPSDPPASVAGVESAELAPYVAAGGSLIVATVALFNTSRQIGSQRRELIAAANRELGYECVDWLATAQLTINDWNERVTQIKGGPDPEEVQRAGAELVARGRQVSAKVNLLFGPSDDVTALLGQALALFDETTYLTRRVIPVAGDRKVNDVLREWRHTISQLYDALAIAAGRPDAARWLAAAKEAEGAPEVVGASLPSAEVPTGVRRRVRRWVRR